LFPPSTETEVISKPENVEEAMDKELQELRNGRSKLFTSVKLDDKCRKQLTSASSRTNLETNTIRSGHTVLFFKTTLPIDPSSFVLSFVRDLSTHSNRKRPHAVKRLTPIMLIGKATEKGIDDLAEKVLAPYFHRQEEEEKKVRGNPIGWYSEFPFVHSGPPQSFWPFAAKPADSALVQFVAEKSVGWVPS
jgi:hypothetical protein